MQKNKGIKKLAGKRYNPSKEEVKQLMSDSQKVTRLKETVRNVFPHLEQCASIYDAQTVVNAISGLIETHIINKISELKISDFEVDLSKDEDGPIKSAMIEILALLKDENAKEMSEALQRLGIVFTQYAAKKYLDQPMKTITINDIVTK